MLVALLVRQPSTEHLRAEVHICGLRLLGPRLADLLGRNVFRLLDHVLSLRRLETKAFDQHLLHPLTHFRAPERQILDRHVEVDLAIRHLGRLVLVGHVGEERRDVEDAPLIRDRMKMATQQDLATLDRTLEQPLEHVILHVELGLLRTTAELDRGPVSAQKTVGDNTIRHYLFSQCTPLVVTVLKLRRNKPSDIIASIYKKSPFVNRCGEIFVSS